MQSPCILATFADFAGGSYVLLVHLVPTPLWLLIRSPGAALQPASIAVSTPLRLHVPGMLAHTA